MKRQDRKGNGILQLGRPLCPGSGVGDRHRQTETDRQSGTNRGEYKVDSDEIPFADGNKKKKRQTDRQTDRQEGCGRGVV
jgi:hypothetical protein